MTKIEWTNETYNPIIGCSKISTGCKNCYAERMAKRLAAMENTKEYGEIIIGGKWNANLIYQDHQIKKPLKWKKPRKIFVCSMSDLFHEYMPFEWIDNVFSVIQKTPQHTYQILTKRPGNMLKYFIDRGIERPYLNVWLGISAENQNTFDIRIDDLIRTPSVLRFISFEPLLAPVEIGNKIDTLDWVIVGGESGPDARPMLSEWVRSIRNECKNAEVPFFFKQWDRMTAKTHGRLLDGKEYNEYPTFKTNNKN